MQNKGLHEIPAIQASTRLPQGGRFYELDVVTMVPEKFMSVATGRAPANAPASMCVDRLLNQGCFNPTSTAGTRWSMYSYGLVPAEEVPRRSANPKFQYNTPKKCLELLVSSLFADLKTAQDSFACANVDKADISSESPQDKAFSNSTCATLTER